MATTSLEGHTLGKYRVLESLGRGGMARVYRAYHPQLDRYVAIKVLRSELIEDDLPNEESWYARFQREAQSVAALRHPNIVQVFDFDAEDDVYYMVMELLEGDTLKTRLNDVRIRGEQIPWGEIVRIMLDALDGLAYAHSERMIHRDIKPANILLSKNGQAVIGDFGIAHIIGGTRHTASGALMGTLHYMAPEQGMEGTCDARSDIYSLGIVFYEMLTQRTPFDADTPLAILMKHIHDPLPLPRQINPDIPEPFERIVLKALAKDPASRYQSAEAMAQALRAAAEEATVDLPTRISLPLSFTTTEVPSESVAVISGTTRQVLAARQSTGDVQFADDETDITLGEKLTAAPPTQAPSPPDTESREKRRQRPPRKYSAGRAVLNGILIVLLGNLLLVTLSVPLSNWSIFETGWPAQIFLAALGLCFIMFATGSIWMLIPTGIVLGTGLLLAYSVLNNQWAHWEYSWVLQIWVIALSVVSPFWLSRRRWFARGVSRALAAFLGLIALVAILAIVANSVTGSIPFAQELLELTQSWIETWNW